MPFHVLEEGALDAFPWAKHVQQGAVKVRVGLRL